MKLKSYFLSFLFVVFFSFANAQIIELTFTGKSGTYHVVLDSILIENITQGGDTMLYFPDTVIMLGTVGIEDNGGIEKPEFEILENYPNPFKNQTLIHLNVPETGDVEVFIYNVLGKEVATFSQCLSQGIHSFTFSSGSESMFFLTAIYMSEVRTCRMIGVNGDNNIQSVFRYNGILSNNPAKNSFTSIKGVPYNPGDQFRFVGFAYAGKDTIIDAPLTNYDYEFEFESGIHCPGISSFIYGGQNYSTVKIGDQCWMAENINIGNQINGVNDQTQNGIIEKYCFNDDPLNCQAYGGLYQWNEMMQYYTMPGSQGICPSGWHLPTDEEWKILEGNVDSQYGVGDPEWDIIGWRGFDVGKNLKSANSWSSGIGADLYGFSALAAGRRLSDGTFGSLNLMTYMWISSQYDNTNGWCRYLNDSYDNTRSGYFDKSDGRSVRCLKDTCSPLPTHANAGPDSLSIGSESIALMGNIAINGQGLWSVFSGTGGHFADSTNPTTLFFGLPNNIYNLVWTISNACGSSSDTVQIGFGCFLQPNQADAGPDQNNVCSPVNLSANVPMPGNGTWSILSGSGGSFSDINNPFAAFSGIQDSSYLLQWTISTICGSTSDVVSISFMPPPTQANAGPDSLQIVADSIALMGNIAINGQGLWSVFSGTGGSFADSTNPITIFYGLPGMLYNLVWTISNGCGSSSDTVQIGFGCFLQPNQADAGPDQNNVCSPVNLTANVPMPGNGTWSILSGSGGSFSDINNPFATFSGIQGSSYLLQWTISTICSSTSDVVSISFMPQPTQSNAGPDSLKIVANSIALMGNIAINGQGLWSVFSGTGGSFADTTNPTTIFYGTPGTIYNLVWTISNDCGSSVDNVIISFATPFVCGDTLVDIRDWKNYNTVQIGTQCWMAENLTYMPSVSPASAGSETLPYYYVFGYQGTSVSAAKATSNYQTYGALYNWPAAMAGEAGSNSVPSGVQGVCPAGWHLPSDAEWTVLTDHLGGLSVAGGKMKETGITHWYSPNTGATNSSGFSALPGGAREIDSAFWSLGATASIWSSTDYSSSNALYRRLYYDTTNVNKWGWYKEAGFSVRCIENCFQANAGPDSLNITGDSIILMGNTPVIGQGVWTVINGAGGVFTDSTNPTTIFYGLPGITYNLIWTISNNCGSSSDNVIISFSAPPFVCGDTLLDIRDWKSYKTVQIGTQCWMAENLNIGTMIIGSQYQHDNGIFEKYCYDNDAANCITYGGLYQWDEMMQFVTTPGVQGICPAAWHLPSDEEWKILEGTVDSQYGIGDPEWDISGVYRGYDAGENLKFISGWNSGGNGTDLYGFSALPGGNRWGGGAFTSIGVRGFFWSSTEFVGGQPRARELKNDYVGVGSGDFFDGAGFSVRCLEDCSPQPTQSNAGPDSLNIFADSIALMGNIAINGQGLWSVFSGTGGSFADTTNPTTIFYGTSGTIYNLVWTISNSCGSSSDNVIIDFDASDGVKKVLSNVAVDGKLEESFWDISNQILINLGGSDNTASFGVLWDDDYLYIGVDVVDGTLCTNGRQGWYDDGIEICIDGDYSHGTTFNQYDRRFVKPMWSYWIQEEDGQLQQGVIHQWIETNDGYSMEFAIPWNNFNTTPSVGMNLGFNMVVNDDDNCISNNSLSHLLWTGSSNYYYNSSLWGTLELSGQTVSYSGDYLALINPNGGDFLINNKATIINWVSYGISNIDIEYTTDNGNNWTAIISNYAAVNAYYSWNVPASPSDQCLIRILESGNPSVNDISESVFTISAPLTAVQSLIPNTWKNYQWPYNAYFPLDPNGINGHVGNACGPTTIARILHKWEFPIVGNGMLNFTDNGGYTWSANFGATTYNYDNMPGYLSPSSTPTEYHDVATLNYHSATSMHDVWGSGTDLANMSYAMSQYFRYKVSTVILRKDFTKAEWTKIMMNELDSGRVLLIQGMNLEHLGNWHSNNNIAGHWYHVDGYNNEGKFHVVLGFGNYDGYFDADSLVIYSFNIGTLIGLEPDLNGKELSIIIPDGGNNYFPDADTTITWTSTNVSNIRIEYTLDKGQNWINIVNNTPASTGQFTWSVPDTVSLLCQVKISDVSDVNVYDKSDDVFTISDPGVFYCGNTIVDSRDGQIYNTVEIGNQCWLAENLNIGTRIDGVNAQTQNGTIEKYCYNNNTSNCDAYGGLYQWDEMMQYSTTEGVQGICQDGWHLPTDDEWKTLEGFVDNNYPVGAPIWNNTAWRGFDAGKNLKSVSSWSSNSGTNLFGFTALPGGMLEGSAFKDFVGYAYFWTSTENSGNSWFRALAHDRSDVYRNSFSKANGCTVRCIMN